MLTGTGAPQGWYCHCSADAQRDYLPHDRRVAEPEVHSGIRPSTAQILELPTCLGHCARDDTIARDVALLFPAVGFMGDPHVDSRTMGP